MIQQQNKVVHTAAARNLRPTGHIRPMTGCHCLREQEAQLPLREQGVSLMHSSHHNATIYLFIYLALTVTRAHIYSVS